MLCGNGEVESGRKRWEWVVELRNNCRLRRSRRSCWWEMLSDSPSCRVVRWSFLVDGGQAVEEGRREMEWSERRKWARE